MSTELVKSLRTFTIISPGAIPLNKITGITGSRDMKQYYIALLSEYKSYCRTDGTSIHFKQATMPINSQLHSYQFCILSTLMVLCQHTRLLSSI